MFIDISDSDFKNIMDKSFMALPKRWDGKDFIGSIKSLFLSYRKELKLVIKPDQIKMVNEICRGIINTLSFYYEGLPDSAYNEFNSVMSILISEPLKIYSKSGWSDPFQNNSALKLFRVRNVQENTIYKRRDIFHTPYNLRSKVSSCRYSIAGYPSLYLGTSLALCCEETKIATLKDFRLAARFEWVSDLRTNNNCYIKVIELAIKPQDFINEDNEIYRYDNNSYNSRRSIIELCEQLDRIKDKYILWYPLIAACSFMRVNKSDPFASEYIIPQLLMQWVRKHSLDNDLYGIRYFSCASNKASDLGFNYVFPASGEPSKHNRQFCAVLSNSFMLTNPEFLDEYNSLKDCEQALVDNYNIDHVYK